VEVIGRSASELAAVTAITFQFDVEGELGSWPGSDHGDAAFFIDDTTGQRITSVAMDTMFCSGLGSAMLPPPPPPPPVRPPPPAPPATGDGITDLPCGSYPEFMLYSQAVTAACCSDASAPCDAITGLPTACDNICDDILRPMPTVCSQWLGMTGLQATVDAAVATCPPEQPPCDSYPEFQTYVNAVTAACCTTSPCIGGFPTDCPQGCGDMLLPMQSACGTWLTMTEMTATVDTAAALCGGGGH